MAVFCDQIDRFLSGSSFAVAGVSRNRHQLPANAIYRKLKGAGYQVYAVNPEATCLEGDLAFSDIQSIGRELDGVVVATAPERAMAVVEQCARAGVKRVWFHRSFGEGSWSADAEAACQKAGIEVISGACPMMFVKPVDPAHVCMRGILRFKKNIVSLITPGERLRRWAWAWFGMLFLTLLNSALGELTWGKLFTPWVAERLAILPALLLVGLLVWRLQLRWPLNSTREALTIGMIWFVLTNSFNVLQSLVRGNSWSRTMQIFDLSGGQLWLVFTVAASLLPLIFCRQKPGHNMPPTDDLA